MSSLPADRAGARSDDEVPLVIVGSGPAGYTAAIYAARARLRPIVLEGAVSSGGALMSTTDVENFPGFEHGVTGPELMDGIRSQAARFGAVLLSEDAVEVDLQGPVKVVRDSSGAVHRARVVVLAMGSGYRRLGLPGEDRLAGRGVSWCATCDGAFFADQHVVVVGGGDSAMEEAIFLSRFASKVTVVHRRSMLRASAIMAERARATSGVEFLLDSEVVSVDGDDELSCVRVRNCTNGIERDIEASGLFVAIGHEPRSELVRGHVSLDADGYVTVRPGTTLTDVAGVFACGDLVDHRYRQAITAAGTGCMAALDAERYLSETQTPPLVRA